MKILDAIFKPNYYITLFASGFIGIFIYAVQAGDSFVDQNKFFYISTGLPVWWLIRYTYWKMRNSEDTDLDKEEPDGNKEILQDTYSHDIVLDDNEKYLEEEMQLHGFYSADAKIVNETIHKILIMPEESFDRKTWAERILKRSSLEILNEKTRIKVFERFVNTATSCEDYYKIFEAFKWIPDKYIQNELKSLRSLLWTVKTEHIENEKSGIHNEKRDNDSSLKIELKSNNNSTNIHSTSETLSNNLYDLIEIDSYQKPQEESHVRSKVGLKEIREDIKSSTSDMPSFYTRRVQNTKEVTISPINNNQTRIREICHDRGITSLFHFTALSNLRGIMRNGILSNPELIKHNVTYLMTDSNRNDGIIDGTCWSISQPNFYYLKTVQERFPSEKWCILEIGPQVLWRENCVFNQTNAANKKQSSKSIAERSTANAFESLFDTVVFGKGDSVFTRRPTTLSNYPTDIQAEVIIRDMIAPELIKKIHVYDFETKKLVCNEIVTENVQVEITKKLFHKQF